MNYDMLLSTVGLEACKAIPLMTSPLTTHVYDCRTQETWVCWLSHGCCVDKMTMSADEPVHCELLSVVVQVLVAGATQRASVVRVEPRSWKQSHRVSAGNTVSQQPGRRARQVVPGRR